MANGMPNTLGALVLAQDEKRRKQEEEASRGLLSDLGNAVVTGVENIPGALTGLADIPLGALGLDHPISNAADALGELTGFQPGKWAEQRQSLYSQDTQQALSDFRNAEGWLDAGGELLSNPRLVALAAAESVPGIFAGGALGKAAKALSPEMSAATAGAVGEGALMAGQQMDALTGSEAGALHDAATALATGVLGGYIAKKGAELAQRRGVTDVDTAIVDGKLGNSSGAVVPAMLQEGGEEALQSAGETLLYNENVGADLTDQLAQNVLLGAATGSAMGGAANFVPQLAQSVLPSHEELRAIAEEIKNSIQADKDRSSQQTGVQETVQSTQPDTLNTTPEAPLTQGVDDEPATEAVKPELTTKTKPPVVEPKTDTTKLDEHLSKVLSGVTQDGPTPVRLKTVWPVGGTKPTSQGLSEAVSAFKKLPDHIRESFYELPVRTRSQAPVLVERDGQLTYLRPRDIEDETARDALAAIAIKHTPVDELVPELVFADTDTIEVLSDVAPKVPSLSIDPYKTVSNKFKVVADKLPPVAQVSDFVERFNAQAREALKVSDEVRPLDLLLAGVVADDTTAETFKSTLPPHAQTGIDLLRSIEFNNTLESAHLSSTRLSTKDHKISWLLRTDSVYDAITKYIQNPADRSANTTLNVLHNLARGDKQSTPHGEHNPLKAVRALSEGVMQTLSMAEVVKDPASPEYAEVTRDIMQEAAKRAMEAGDTTTASHLFEAAAVAAVGGDKAIAHLVSDETKAQTAWKYITSVAYPYGEASTTELLTANEQPSIPPEDVTKIVEHEVGGSLPQDVTASERWRKATAFAGKVIPRSYTEVIRPSADVNQVAEKFRSVAQRDPMLTPLLERSAKIIASSHKDQNYVAREFKALPALVVPSDNGREAARALQVGIKSQLSEHLPNNLLQQADTVLERYYAVMASKLAGGVHNGFAINQEVSKGALNAAVDALDLPDSDKQTIRSALEKIHIPNVVQVGSNTPEEFVPTVLYHELFHAAVTPALRAVGPKVIQRVAKELQGSELGNIAGMFKRSIKQDTTNAPMQLGAEEALAYVISDIATKAAEQGLSPIQYLNRNVRNKGLRTLITRTILPKIRANLYRKNLLPKSSKADINTVFELIRQYTATANEQAAYQTAPGVMPEKVAIDISDANTLPVQNVQAPSTTPVISALKLKTAAAKYTLARMSDAFNFTHRLIEQASEYLGPLPKQYMQLMDEQSSKVRMLTSDLHDISQQLSAMDDIDVERAVRLLDETQRLNHGVGEDVAYWPFMPDWLPEELQSKVTIDPTLQGRFEELSPQMQDIVKRMYKLSYTTSRLHLDALKTYADSTFGDVVASDVVGAEELPRLQKEMLGRLRRVESLLHRPYTPLMRDGKYVVVMESDEMRKLSTKMQELRNEIATIDLKIKRLVANGELESDAITALREERRALLAKLDSLRAQYEEGQGDSTQYAFYMADSLEEATRIKQGLEHAHPTNTSFIAEREAVRDRVANIDKLVDFAAINAKRVLGEHASSGVEALLNLYILEQHTNSVWNSFKDRKFVKGYNENLLASMARGIKMRASSAVSLQYVFPIRDVLLKMQHAVDNAAPSQKLQMQRYVNEIIRRHQIFTRPLSDSDRKIEEAVSGLLAANAWYTLLMSPRFYAQTWLQNIVSTFPLLSEFGVSKAAKTLLDAHKDVWEARKRTKDEFGLGLIKGLISGELLTQNSIKNERERKLLDALWTSDVLDVGLVTDMGEFDNILDSNKLKTKFKRGHYMFMHAARVADLHARAAAGIAAYRLKYKQATTKEVLDYKQKEGFKTADEARHALAVEYAKKILLTAHGNYSQFNAPRAFVDTPFLRHGAGRLITQFRKFQLIQLYMIADLIRAASKKATTPEEKAAVIVARKQLAVAAATIFGLTGLLGMPAAATIIHLVAMAGGDDLPDDDAVILKLREWFGPAADLALHGIPSLVGANLTDMIGYQNILSIAPYNQIDISKDGYSELLTALSGAPGSTIGRLMDSYKLASEGRFLDAAVVGLPSGPRQLLDAVRIHMQGGLRDKAGNLYMREEDISALQEVLHMLNLSPASISKTREIHYGVKAVQKALNEKQQELTQAMAEAFRSNDIEAVRELTAEWVNLQKLKLKWGIKPSPTPGASVLNKLKSDHRFMNGVPYTPATALAVRRVTEASPL